MASLVKYGNGLRRIEFRMQPNERPRIIRLGKMTVKSAESIRTRIERIVSDLALNRPHDPDLADWLGSLEDWMLQRFRNVGLADGVGLTTTTLGGFLERYFASNSVKPSTQTFYKHTRRNLEKHFGKTKALRSITAEDADAFRAWLVENEKLSAATVGRRVVAARTFWRKAIRWNLAADNPFEGVKGGHQANEARKQYVPAADIIKVMEAAPDAEWRAVIALARWGGLRTPSETFELKWSDIDWDRGTIRITCPKLAHRESFAQRTIPLFPELRAPLLDLFEQAADGAVYVAERLRTGCGNIGVHLRRIIKRAGLTVWPKVWHNLRASRETELMREYDLATVCKWIGNSPAVAARHYATSVDLNADFQRATGDEAQWKAQRLAQKATPADADQPVPTSDAEASEAVRNPPEDKQLGTDGETLSPDGDSGPEANPWALLDLNQ